MSGINLFRAFLGISSPHHLVFIKFFEETHMRINFLIAGSVMLMVTGCTGTQVKVSPESITQTFKQPYSSVGVRDVPAEKTGSSRKSVGKNRHENA